MYPLACHNSMSRHKLSSADNRTRHPDRNKCLPPLPSGSRPPPETFFEPSSEPLTELLTKHSTESLYERSKPPPLRLHKKSSVYRKPRQPSTSEKRGFVGVLIMTPSIKNGKVVLSRPNCLDNLPSELTSAIYIDSSDEMTGQTVFI